MPSPTPNKHKKDTPLCPAMSRALVWLRRKIPAWIATGLTVSAILWLTLARTPLPETDLPMFPGADKLVHAIMFGWLTLVVCWDRYASTHKRLNPRQIAVCATISILFGGVVEIAQDVMGCGRSADIWDFTADTIGALTVMAALLRRP